ncbi:MAG: PAS domain S-box protein [Desulforhopalus sp.]|nr:PAS domain S-box protein [Desulforhopalus sp.]
MQKILAIDDKDDNLITLSALLKYLLPGCMVSTARSGLEGIEMARTEQPDVILLDVLMPGMDGFETCRYLKTDTQTSTIPVIMITAIKTDHQSRVKGLDLGADAFLSKPIDEAELVSQVKVALRIKSAEDTLRQERRSLAQEVAKRTRALRESEYKYRVLFESAGDAIYIHDEEARILAANTTACELLGYTQSELLSLRVADVDTPEEARFAPERIAKLRDRGRLSFTSSHRRRDGSTIPVEVSARIISWEGQSAMMSICRDITERKRAEEALSKKAALLAQTEAISQTGSWRYTADTGKITWSDGMYTIFGTNRHSPDDTTNVSVTPAVHPEDRAQVLENRTAVLADGLPRPIEYRIIRPDGTIRWIHSQSERETDASGRVIALVGFAQDVTERKRLESEREILITAIEQAPVAIALTSQDGTIEYVNPAFAQITGYSGAELIGQNPRIVKSGKHDQGFYAELWQTITSGRVWKGQITNKRKDGSLYVEDTTISPVVDSHRHVQKYVAIKRDITAEMAMESKLRQAQKMEAIGTLAGGIAHDFNNILGAIIGYAEMVRDDSPASSPAFHDINQVLKAGLRAKELVKQILAFSRQGEIEQVAVQPANIIKEAIKLLRASLPATITIEQDIDTNAGAILADPTQIHQIVMNLCTNAFHAMEQQGGTLTISLGKKQLTGEDLGANPHMQQGDFIQLSIRDTGTGIPLEIRERIFDPYFTTKEVGKGTGMGLATVHGIIQSYGGAITCDSRPGNGAVFHVILPAIEKYSTRDTDSSALALTGREHILLVDDEEILAEMSTIMLERLGYQVTTKTKSFEALTAFQNEPKRFDVVICDLTMPGMTGIDLSRRLLQIRPDLPIILCTGYSSLVSEEKVKSMGIRGFAMKPLTKNDIATLIRKILDDKN